MRVDTENVSVGILEEISIIDKIGYPKVTTPLEWYIERYQKLETIVVARKNGKMIGYCCLTGIDEDIHKVILKGLLTGDYSITPKAYKTLSEGDTFYMSSVVVHPDERMQNIVEKMMYKVISGLIEYTEKYNIVTIAITPGGKRIADKTGFREIMQVGESYILQKQVKSEN